jgi:DNA-binding sugar fermentation-stimulating protein
MSLLLTIENLVEGTVAKRPSKFIKTPYVADINIVNKPETVLGHTASLGCCGLADVGATIMMAPSKNKVKHKEKQEKQENDKLKCEYSVYLSVIKERNEEIVIGIHPKLAENLVEATIKANLFQKLQNIKGYKREKAIYIKDQVDSRFDFIGVDCNDIPFIMEVKNVPLADYEDISRLYTSKRPTKSAVMCDKGNSNHALEQCEGSKKDRKNVCYEDRDINSKVAYFPDGYRKKSVDPVSPRALKHIRELTLIKQETKIRCIMCYVIQRTDVDRFQPSVVDPEYREAVKIAIDAGVEVITLVIKWTKNGEAYFVRDDLPITAFS